MCAIYDRLSFQVYDWHRPRLDTEWLLSTLFDASLLSTFKAAVFGGFFLPVGAIVPIPHVIIRTSRARRPTARKP
jgi:hypothetical protein